MAVVINSFETLIEAAREQSEPQRLLVVFLKTLLPSEHSDEQKQRYEQGQGGALQPVFCADLDPAALSTFAELVQEADQMETDWHVVLVACLAGQDGAPPTHEQTEEWLELMQQVVNSGGNLSRFLAFTRTGEPVHFSSATG